jgi:hypothetical protein
MDILNQFAYDVLEIDIRNKDIEGKLDFADLLNYIKLTEKVSRFSVKKV